MVLELLIARAKNLAKEKIYGKSRNSNIFNVRTETLSPGSLKSKIVILLLQLL